MNDNINELAFKLHDQLLSSKEYLQLKMAEKEMNEDAISFQLVENYHKAMEAYGEKHSEKALQNLHETKYAMDTNEKVIAYKKAYKDYQLLITTVTDITFDGFKEKTTIEEIMKI